MKIGIGLGLGFARGVAGSAPPAYNPSTDLAGYQFSIDPSVIGTLYTDTAGTVPVTAPGDLVACVRDPYTNAIVATQATSANRPIYQVDVNGDPYLQMRSGATLRWLVTGTFNFTTAGIGRILIVAAIQQDARATFGTIIRILASNGSFQMNAPEGSTTSFTSRGSIAVSAGFTDTAAPTPRKMLIGGYASIPNDNVLIRLDKTQRAQNTADQGTTLSYANATMLIGANQGTGADGFDGRIYGLIFAANATTDYVDADIIPAENFLDAKLNP